MGIFCSSDIDAGFEVIILEYAELQVSRLYMTRI